MAGEGSGRLSFEIARSMRDMLVGADVPVALTRHDSGVLAGLRSDAITRVHAGCREQWVQHSKDIVGLSDDDVIQMVRTKMAGNDPAELVRQKRSRTSGWESRPATRRSDAQRVTGLPRGAV